MHRYTRHGFFGGQAQHREDMVFVAVHAARRNQAKHVQGGVRGLVDRIAGRDKFRVVEKASIRDRRVDPGQILIHHPAGAQIHMPDFGVAHLAFRQTHTQAGGMHQRMRAIAQQRTPMRQVRLGHGVVGGILAMAPAIQDQQQYRFGSRHVMTSSS